MLTALAVATLNIRAPQFSTLQPWDFMRVCLIIVDYRLNKYGSWRVTMSWQQKERKIRMVLTLLPQLLPPPHPLLTPSHSRWVSLQADCHTIPSQHTCLQDPNFAPRGPAPRRWCTPHWSTFQSWQTYFPTLTGAVYSEHCVLSLLSSCSFRYHQPRLP